MRLASIYTSTWKRTGVPHTLHSYPTPLSQLTCRPFERSLCTAHGARFGLTARNEERQVTTTTVTTPPTLTTRLVTTRFVVVSRWSLCVDWASKSKTQGLVAIALLLTGTRIRRVCRTTRGKFTTRGVGAGTITRQSRDEIRLGTASQFEITDRQLLSVEASSFSELVGRSVGLSFEWSARANFRNALTHPLDFAQKCWL